MVRRSWSQRSHHRGDRKKLNAWEVATTRIKSMRPTDLAWQFLTLVHIILICPHDQPLALHNVLLVPQAQKSLLSAHCLTSGNNVSIELFPNGFVVKDLTSRKVLAWGGSEGSIYPIYGRSSSHHRSVLSASVKPTHSRWHRHLGHLSSIIVDNVLSCFGPKDMSSSGTIQFTRGISAYIYPLVGHHLFDAPENQTIISSIFALHTKEGQCVTRTAAQLTID